MEMKLPKLRGERLVIVSLMMILAAESINTFWPLEVSRTNTFKNIFVNILELGNLLLIISLITTGIRAIRFKLTSIKGIAMTTIGIGICLLPVLGIYTYSKLGKGLYESQTPRMEAINIQLQNKSLPFESKIKLSRMYAKNKFLYEGVIVKYLSENGEYKNYVPSTDDYNFNKLRTDSKRAWSCNCEKLFKELWWWVALAVISCLIGILTPIRKTPPNMPLELIR